MGFRKKKTLLDQAKEQASDFVDTVRPQVEAAVSTAKEKAGPVIADAREKAAPHVDAGKAKAATTAAAAAAAAAPHVAKGKAKLDEGRDLAAAKALAGLQAAEGKVAALQSDPPKKKRRFRKVLVLGLIAGGAAIAVKALQSDKGDNWQSTYTPPPPPAPKPTPVAETPVPEHAAAPEKPADDATGATPGEALADAAETPHPVTTPDDPAEVVDIKDDKA